MPPKQFRRQMKDLICESTREAIDCRIMRCRLSSRSRVADCFLSCINKRARGPQTLTLNDTDF